MFLPFRQTFIRYLGKIAQKQPQFFEKRLPGLPDGTGTLGTALLLLGLNVARYRRHIPLSDFSLILGMLALIDGGVHLLRSLFAFHIHLEFFPVLMVIIGTIMMVHAVDRLR